ncbi:MAG TPA: universal stress protein [Ktedonobacterales bacterium]|nr:universal stress protein [Ktedonobacterales bacterium]
MNVASEPTGAIRHILVPLDGSGLAEAAMPVAVTLARATGATLVLAHVTSNLTWAFAAETGLTSAKVYDDLLAGEDAAAAGYLMRRHATLPPDVAAVMLHVRGDVAVRLLTLIEQQAIDLVVMTTHGYTGLRRFTLGSVADRLARAGAAPVLLLRSFESAAAAGSLEHALIPLDGSAHADSALIILEPLVGTLVRQVTLVRVIGPSESDAVAAEVEAALHAVRDRLQQAWGERGCAVDVSVLRGQPAQEIIGQAGKLGAFIVMATRGQTGWTRWTMGSVADRLLQGATAPLLLVNPRSAATARLAAREREEQHDHEDTQQAPFST